MIGLGAYGQPCLALSISSEQQGTDSCRMEESLVASGEPDSESSMERRDQSVSFKFQSTRIVSRSTPSRTPYHRSSRGHSDRPLVHVESAYIV